MTPPRDFAPVQAGPAIGADAVTPNDGTDLPGGTTRGLYVGTGGNLIVYMGDSAVSVTFTGVPNGAILPLCVARVLATGTTASNIVALY